MCRGWTGIDPYLGLMGAICNTFLEQGTGGDIGQATPVRSTQWFTITTALDGDRHAREGII